MADENQEIEGTTVTLKNGRVYLVRPSGIVRAKQYRGDGSEVWRRVESVGAIARAARRAAGVK
jgi:hypothetical protein